jgi:aquaporin related protein
MGGACFAAYLVKVMYPTPLQVQTTLGEGVTIAQGLFIEALCTAELVFTIIMLAKEKHRATFMAPIGIGFALFIGELAAVYYTGGSLNPARSFGPAAVLHSFDVHHWIYWVGPFIGTLLAVVFYRLIKILEYEMANPGQDGDFENDPTQNPNHEIAQVVEERQAEVQEIQAIQQQGGFQTLRDSTLIDQPPVLDNQGVIGMTVEGIRAGDEVRVQRVRPPGDEDLEAQWPATNGVGAPGAQAALGRRDTTAMI